MAGSPTPDGWGLTNVGGYLVFLGGSTRSKCPWPQSRESYRASSTNPTSPSLMTAPPAPAHGHQRSSPVMFFTFATGSPLGAGLVFADGHRERDRHRGTLRSLHGPDGPGVEP